MTDPTQPFEASEETPGETPRRRTARQVDILELPGIRTVVRQWSSMILANSAVRREAKALLFQELAEACRQGVPLEIALALNSQTVAEAGGRVSADLNTGADKRHRGLQHLFVFFMIITANLLSLVYTVLAFRYADVERVARLLALRLHAKVAAGNSLSDAMALCTPDYRREEVEIIRAGEKWGHVADAIRSVADFQITETRLTLQGTQAIYPLILASILIIPVSFVRMHIMPKFDDIYSQLGSSGVASAAGYPLGWFGKAVAAALLHHGPIVGALAVAAFLAFAQFFIVRTLLNGNRISKVILGIAVLVMELQILGFAASTFDVWARNSSASIGAWELGGMVAIVALGLAIPVSVPYFMRLLERVVLFLERALAPLLRLVPILGRAHEAEAQSRWLATLTVALQAGIPAPEAIAAAGETCGGGIRRRSRKAAELAAQGHAIGEACARASVLKRTTNARLRLLDGNRNYLHGLKMIGQDLAADAFEIGYRTGRAAETFGTVAVIVVGLFVLVGMYNPLFNIPKAVMNYEVKQGKEPARGTQF